MSVREVIWQGYDYREKHTLPASGIEVEIRPLSLLEVDNCYVDALIHLPKQEQEIIIKILSGILDPTKPLPKEVEIGEVYRYYNEVRYRFFATATGMKVSDVINLPYGDDVKGITERIMRISGINEKVAREDVNLFVKNGNGEFLASLHYEGKCPIASPAWKITPLQISFLNREGEEVVFKPETDGEIRDFFGLISDE